MGDDNFYKGLSCAIILSWVNDYKRYINKKNDILNSRKHKKTKEKELKPIEWEMHILEKQLHSMKTYCYFANLSPDKIIEVLNS